MKYTIRYSYRRLHPWWKFWCGDKWVVFRIKSPHYILGAMTKKSAFDLASSLNNLGS